MDIRVETLPAYHVASKRHVGPYHEIGRAYEDLMGWAGPKGLLGRPDVKIIGVYHDSPEATPPEELRADACVTVPPGTEGDDGIDIQDLPGGAFVIGHTEIAEDGFGRAWEELMGWFPMSGYEPADGPGYEICLEDPKTHPEGKFVVELCMPVKKLGA